MKARVLWIALAMLMAAGGARADTTTKVMPAWALRSFQKSIDSSRAVLSAPARVSGVRGREFQSDELYWKSAGPPVKALVEKGEEHLAASRSSQARRAFLGALISGASGQLADRAMLGFAGCDLAEGKVAPARVRLTRLMERTRYEEIRVASGIQLAIALSVDGDKEAAIALLKRIREEHSDHPLASQVPAILWVLEGE